MPTPGNYIIVYAASGDRVEGTAEWHDFNPAYDAAITIACAQRVAVSVMRVEQDGSTTKIVGHLSVPTKNGGSKK